MKKILTTLTMAALCIIGTAAMAQHPQTGAEKRTTSEPKETQAQTNCQQQTANCQQQAPNGQQLTAAPNCPNHHMDKCQVAGNPQHQGCAQGHEGCQKEHHGMPHHDGCKEGHHGMPQHDCCNEGHGHHHSFQPHGKTIVTLFEHVGATSTSEGWSVDGFQMERAYLGYEYQFSPAWSTTVILDAQQGNGLSIERVFVKNAFAKYHRDGLTIMAGIVPTVQGTLAESNWGYRYVAKSFYDLNGFGQTADLGIYAKYDINDMFSADLSVLNGEGFRRIQMDNDFLYGAGLTFKPYKEFTLRVYGDINTHRDTINYADTMQSMKKNLQVFAGYDGKHFRLGADYNWQWGSNLLKGQVLNGLSIYATGKITPKFNIFARYDKGYAKDKIVINPTTGAIGLAENWSTINNDQDIFLGVEYRINKLISLAPAIQYHIFADNTNKMYAYLSAKVAF